ncbi:XRE family transcriptional regulator [Streptomyces sp. SL13]|uniref:XRE family transcriptional regulator n=1 Tax=Streptantibioticus silvisoli TaxID=2705255 RepID=A0AA90GZA6_9ACTN|nr:XRE family transcriptional regulator [Streptantibioticus silvisoli]MDI5968386.1 XRE family transcriptional regulator [Streptantibioticus silvisoli]
MGSRQPPAAARRPNVVLRARMQALRLTEEALAEQMNEVLLIRTGRRGECNDRTIRRFLSGQTCWPQGRSRLALAEVFGSTAEQLGFIPRSAHETEDPVQRRSFLTSAASVAASPMLAGTAQRRVGAHEITSLREALNDLIANEHQTGGHASLEVAALRHGQQAIDLVQKGSPGSDFVRRQLYSVAADAVTTAAWSAIETGDLRRAQQHLERSLALAGYSSDSTGVLRAWNNLAMLAQRRDHFADAAAAADAARNTAAARRDPLLASLAHARAAIAHSAAHNPRQALRSLDYAKAALSKSSDTERPEWLAFYDGAELDGLAALTSLNLGHFADAEYNAHRSLARIKPGLQRNRTYYTVLLGLSQIRQGELEQACATVDPLYTRALPSSTRIAQMLTEFRTYASATGSATARRWLNDTRHV